MYVDYQFQDVTVEVDPEIVEDDTPGDTTEETGNEANPWMLASSIALVAVLLLAIVSVLFRKVLAKFFKKLFSKFKKKDKKSKEKVKKEKKAKKQAVEQRDENSPYND
jgi:uncharacterized protein HemX